MNLRTHTIMIKDLPTNCRILRYHRYHWSGCSMNLSGTIVSKVKGKDLGRSQGQEQRKEGSFRGK